MKTFVYEEEVRQALAQINMDDACADLARIIRNTTLEKKREIILYFLCNWNVVKRTESSRQSKALDFNFDRVSRVVELITSELNQLKAKIEENQDVNTILNSVIYILDKATSENYHTALFLIAKVAPLPYLPDAINRNNKLVAWNTPLELTEEYFRLTAETKANVRRIVYAGNVHGQINVMANLYHYAQELSKINDDISAAMLLYAFFLLGIKHPSTNNDSTKGDL